MGLKEELAAIDLEQAEEVFDDIFPPNRRVITTQEDQNNFALYEVTVSAGQFPVFKSILRKFQEMSPKMLEQGVITKEQLHGIFMGMAVTQMVLAGYAERQLPDTIPPDFGAGDA